MQQDRFGRTWPQGTELCPECGQPDNCGDCSHKPLTDDDAASLGAVGYAPCPSCGYGRPEAEPDGATFRPGSVCPHCGHVEPDGTLD